MGCAALGPGAREVWLCHLRLGGHLLLRVPVLRSRGDVAGTWGWSCEVWRGAVKCGEEL